MICSVTSLDELPESIEHVMLNASNVLIKINLARPPQPNIHPRTDARLLERTAQFLVESGKKVTICESADGFLQQNLDAVGLGDKLKQLGVGVVDIDKEESYPVEIAGQKVLIPKFFADYDLRISIPCASKREDMLFSNNIKNFFGATPRIGYQRGEGRWRATLHDDLAQSIVNVFDAFEQECPFRLYINGGNAYSESKGPFEIEEIHVSEDPIRLDSWVFHRYFEEDEKPEYLDLMELRFTTRKFG